MLTDYRLHATAPGGASGQSFRGCAMLAAAVILIAVSGCGRAAQPIHIDLLSLLARAERRPVTPGNESFVVRAVPLDGSSARAVYVPQPSRIIWTLRIPRRATLTVRHGLMPDSSGKYDGDAVFRIGVSGGRIYEKLYERAMNPRDVPADRVLLTASIDLSAYAGWQWSLFYRPSEQQWGVVFSVDNPRSASTPVWVDPTITGVK